MAKQKPQSVKTIAHRGVKRKNIPTAEMEKLVPKTEAQPKTIPHRNNPKTYHRDPDLDPQLVWHGKDAEDTNGLRVDAHPIYVHEHIHPKVIIDDLKRNGTGSNEAPSLFETWTGGLSGDDRWEFYAHQQPWTNRFILGDSLLVMQSLAEKESMKGKVQCIYMDPPYGIKFSSNWQPSTRKRNVTDKDFTGEPEMIKAYRDTWEKGIHSYLSYLRDRLIIARELLTDSGSFFMQIGEENVHLVRSLMDEVFGKENFYAQITFRKKDPLSTKNLGSVCDYILWYAQNKEEVKYRPIFDEKEIGEGSMFTWLNLSDGSMRRMTVEEKQKPQLALKQGKPFRTTVLTAAGIKPNCSYDLYFQGQTYKPSRNSWMTTSECMERVIKSDRVLIDGKTPSYKQYFADLPVTAIHNVWMKTRGAQNPIYVVQTNINIVTRCLLMATDPGDLVLDPTCGSGTTAYVAEKYGRRWITIDASRVAISLARSRLMGGKFEWYLLQDSKEGAAKESELSKKPILSGGGGVAPAQPNYGNKISDGFVCRRVPRITLARIANNTEIDEIWEAWQPKLDSLCKALNKASGENYKEEWQIPHEADSAWSAKAKSALADWWQVRLARQKEIDDSISKKADMEYLNDQPYTQKGVVRVTGPFTVESISPHRHIPTDGDDETLRAAMGEDVATPNRPKSMVNSEAKFHEVVTEYLKRVGVQTGKKKERLEFTSLDAWPGGKGYVHLEGRYLEKDKEKKVAICIGPEFGSVSRTLLTQAAREAADYFDLLVVLGFAFEGWADKDVVSIGSMPVIRARMNNDLHMANRLKTTKSGNLFVAFGEPDIKLHTRDGGLYAVEILGIDTFDPTTGDVRSNSTDEIACWFIDTDYNEEAFFVRHAYFLKGGSEVSDPYKALKKTLQAEISPEAWDTIHRFISRPFPKPEGGRIAVKAINHLGDEVLRIFTLP
ncbi:MAG: site-specific DNA-methyltransferase [Proteobacteria bacterium]|nr:site-specific DNA-methyltransferase [Pseudomonadota bacterium]